MCSFDYHFHRAMEYEDDLVWIMAVYYNLMHAICMIYYWDNESNGVQGVQTRLKRNVRFESK